MELREKIADEISDIDDYRARDEILDAADRILSLPEIKEALRYRNVILASHMPDLPPERVGEIMRDLANRVAE